MIRCEDCGELFEEERVISDHGRLIRLCPRCGSEEIGEVHRCCECGTWSAEEHLCESCAGRTLRLFREVLHLYFSAEQVDFLAESDCF